MAWRGTILPPRLSALLAATPADPLNQLYHPDDIKGKGEPSFTLERSLKQHRSSDHRRVLSEGGAVYEMTAPGRPLDAESSNENVCIPPSASYRDWQEGIQRRNTTGRSMGQSLRKRIGSLGRKGVP